MKNMLGRAAGYLPTYLLVSVVLLACVAGAVVGAWNRSLSTMTTILWLLAAGGAVCLMLRRSIDADDRTRELNLRLAREQAARRGVEEILADTQTVLSKVVRQQESVRDGERARIAREIHDQLGQPLLSLRADLSLQHVASNGLHPALHQKTGAMIGTLDGALGSLRAVVSELRPLALGEGLRGAIERQLEEFTRLSGIAHRLEISPGALGERDMAAFEGDALLYRVLQQALADLAHQAGATEVRVGLQRGSDGLTLRIDDNGHGNRRPAPPCACGLAGMRERVEACGGALRIIARSDGGMALALTLPQARGLAPA